MKCHRCQGLMVRDEIFDPDDPYLHIEVMRCVNCGETMYVDKKALPIINHSAQTERKKSKAA